MAIQMNFDIDGNVSLGRVFFKKNTVHTWNVFITRRCSTREPIQVVILDPAELKPTDTHRIGSTLLKRGWPERLILRIMSEMKALTQPICPVKLKPCVGKT